MDVRPLLEDLFFQKSSVWSNLAIGEGFFIEFLHLLVLILSRGSIIPLLNTEELKIILWAVSQKGAKNLKFNFDYSF